MNLDIHKELRELCERQGEALKKLAQERDAAIATAEHIAAERDTLKGIVEELMTAEAIYGVDTEKYMDWVLEITERGRRIVKGGQ